MMNIVPIHYKPSKRVESFAAIMRDAEDMKKLIDAGNFAGTALALSHCQVSTDPWAFFVVAEHLVKNGFFEDRVIINARILAAHGETRRLEEGCLSFPHRKAKKVDRFFAVDVEYMVPLQGMLAVIKKTAEWLPAEILQHEIQHSEGRNIFFNGPKQ